MKDWVTTMDTNSTQNEITQNVIKINVKLYTFIRKILK